MMQFDMQGHLVNVPERKNTFFMDMERCPYLPRDFGYEEWIRRDNERLLIISNERTHLRALALKYLSHEDRIIRDMAKFITTFLEE